MGQKGDPLRPRNALLHVRVILGRQGDLFRGPLGSALQNRDGAFGLAAQQEPQTSRQEGHQDQKQNEGTGHGTGCMVTPGRFAV